MNGVTLKTDELEERRRVRREILDAYHNAAYDNEHILNSAIALYTQGYYDDFWVYYEMVLGYMEEEYAMGKFQLTYEELDDDQIECIREAIMDGDEECVEDRIDEVLTEENVFYARLQPTMRMYDLDDYSQYKFINSPLEEVW